MLTNNYLLKLGGRIICSSDSKIVLIELIKKLKKDLGDIEEQFEKGKELLINSGKYPINDPEVNAPVYSRALSEQFKLLKNKIWSNPKYLYLLDYDLKDIIYYKNSAWCKFEIEKINENANETVKNYTLENCAKNYLINLK